MKTFIKYMINFLPSFFKKKVKKKILHKKIDKHKERKKRIFISLDEINSILDKFDFKNDILIHSSTSNIGKIEGGATKLTNLIISKINLNKSTLLAPALSFVGPVKNYLDSLDSFEFSTAKNLMGNISNQIMKKEGCKRSYHPSHSVIAIGKNSDEYIKYHEKSKTPFSHASPYAKLAINNGKILMFGVDLNSVTNFHVYEDMLGIYLPFNVYTNKKYNIKCIKNGMETIITTRAHSPMLSAKRDCERARKYLERNNYIQTYKLGDSEISLLDANGLTITLLEMLLIGESIYGSVKISTKQEEKIKNILGLLQ